MAGLSVIFLMGALGILFIIFVVFNIILFIFIILAIVFGIIRAVKKKFKKTFIVFLILAIVFTIIDVSVILYVHNNLLTNETTEESKELTAIKNSEYDKVKEYIENGWDPNESSLSVYYSIKYNNIENKENDEWPMLELLLENGANPNVQIFESPTGVNTPLTYTAECGYYGATELLLEYDADINYKESRFGYTPIHAIKYWDNDMASETLEIFLDYGADLKIKDGNGKSGLDELKDFEADYKKYKENVPDYDDVMEIIDNIEK